MSRYTLLRSLSASPLGYRQFVDLVSGGSLLPFLQRPVPIHVDERKRAKHTFVAGSSGSGKSEFLKALVFEYVTKRPNDAIVIIDPHGSFAKQVARFPEVARSGRLVYLDPGQFPHTPVFNPLDCDADTASIDVHLSQLLQALTAVLSEGSEFSAAMTTLLKPCLKTLLYLPGSTLDDLMRFINGDEDLLQYADDVLTNPNDRAYLRATFGRGGHRGENLGQTKYSIQTRLQQLLGDDTFRHFLCGETSFDLEGLLAQSKIIIFSLKETSGDPTFSPINAIGRFLFAKLLGIALKKDHPSISSPVLPPIHCFTDESHNYCIPSIWTILAEARKYGLHLTLATQSLSNFDDRRIKDGVKKNTFLKVVGFQPNGVTDNSTLVGVSPGDISGLRAGQFYVAPGDLPRFRISVRSDLIDNTHAIPDLEWNEILAEQIARYYCDTSLQPVASPLTADSQAGEPATVTKAVETATGDLPGPPICLPNLRRLTAMKFIRITPNRRKALYALARFNYLTKAQFLRLGITTDQSNLASRVLRPLTNQPDPLVQVANVGSTHVFALTRSGAEMMAEQLEVENVFYPPNGIQYLRDFEHRVGTVDFLIQLWRYAKSTGTPPDFLHAYFHNGCSEQSRFIAATRHEIGHGLFTEADLEFRLNSHLYVFEFHRQNRTGRIYQQLEFHRVALQKGTIAEHYHHPHPPMILSVYENAATRDSVMNRLRVDAPFKPFFSCFAFAVMKDVLEDLSGAWLRLDDSPTPFADLTRQTC